MTSRSVPGLLQVVRRFGRFDVNACLGCGSCTVVCSLATDSRSFPRKPMRRALLGLRDSLRGGLEPWLCHDCGECAVTCPRQAEPRESMMTLRRYLIAQYDFTHIASRVLGSRLGEILTLSLVGLLVLALVLVYHLTYKEIPMTLSEFVATPFGLEHMFPTIQNFTMVVFAIPIVLLLINMLRMHHFTARELEPFHIPLRCYFLEVKSLLVHMLSHKNMRACADAVLKRRWAKHWLVAFAVSLMLFVKFFFLDWFQTDAIHPIYHPQRWLGYAAAALMLYVPLDILISRARKRVEMHKFSAPSDLILPAMLFLVALSGLAVHVFRYLEFGLTSHILYAVHLTIAVPLVLIELPFGKWSHGFYRAFALYFQAVRERAMAEAQSKEPLHDIVPAGVEST
ncbi:MAG: 4Fe-4S dicluster domain-containing protein [Bacteroidota bacterium]